jgi:hypothetical protein
MSLTVTPGAIWYDPHRSPHGQPFEHPQAFCEVAPSSMVSQSAPHTEQSGKNPRALAFEQAGSPPPPAPLLVPPTPPAFPPLVAVPATLLPPVALASSSAPPAPPVPPPLCVSSPEHAKAVTTKATRQSLLLA